MKKYLYLALALPMMFACSSEDFDEKVVSNDQFAGIAKVEATFSMDEGQRTRFDGGVWNTEEGDLWGFAWEGDGTVVPVGTGVAKQNHNLIQTNGIFTPQTSIFVGDYFLYRPYDKTTVSPQAINFTSLVDQPFAEGYESAKQPWKDLAKTAINIGDKWTNVTPTGWTDLAGKTWDKAGIKEHYSIYAAMFSNQTGLDLTYVKNNPTFAAATAISGATDIDYTFAAGTEVGAADIYEATVNLAGQAKSFTYAPTAEPNGAAHSGTYWENKSNLGAGQGFTFTPGAITLTPEDAVNGLSTGDNGSKGYFWFNSLPVTAGNGTAATAVQTVFTTSYGVVTINETVGGCAYVFEQPDGAATAPKEWIKIVATATDQTKTPKEWNLGDLGRKTFVNQYGNHKGKYAFDVDFSTGVMNGMDIRNDAHLQKLLKYYIASSKNNEPNVALNLLPASATDNTFKISKMSIALLQTINRGANKVYVIVTQDGQGDLGLADKKEVPELDDVFNTPTDVALSKDCEWTWKERTAPAANVVTIDGNVNSLTNEGTLTVNATNIELSPAPALPLANAADATMNITKVTTVKTALTNLGTINVPAGAELRAYDVEIKNDATSLTDYGVINNAGVVGVTYATTGTVNNYGKIIMESSDAITLLTSNQTAAGNFDDAFDDGTGLNPANKLGTVVLPAGQPNALVSVSNGAETGFIEYTWTGGTTYATPNGGIVKYNTLIVSDNIKFTTAETEIRFIKFEGVRKTVTNSTNANLPNLKGIIIKDNCSIIIEKGNTISCSEGSHLGNGAAVYNGGAFTPGNTNIAVKIVTDYLGTWNTDQIVVW